MTENPEEAVPPPPADAIPADQFKQLIDAINKRVPKAAHCRSCGKNQVSVAPHAVSPLVIHNGGTLLGGTTYPQIMLICGHCGETRYHNAVVLGVQLEGGDGG